MKCALLILLSFVITLPQNNYSLQSAIVPDPGLWIQSLALHFNCACLDSVTKHCEDKKGMVYFFNVV